MSGYLPPFLKFSRPCFIDVRLFRLLMSIIILIVGCFRCTVSAPNKAAESVTARYNSSNYCADSVSEPSQPPISSYPASETLHSDEGAIGPYPDYSVWDMCDSYDEWLDYVLRRY